MEKITLKSVKRNQISQTAPKRLLNEQPTQKKAREATNRLLVHIGGDTVLKSSWVKV